MAIERTEFIDTMSYGVDLKSRRIYFGSHLDSADTSDEVTHFSMRSVEYVVRALHRMVEDASNKAIELHMCSYGGDMYSMMRLHDEILACPAQIKFIGSGAIMSCASFIMCACDERYLHVNATVMVHELSDASSGTHTDIQVNATENRRIMSRLYDIYAANSKMPRTFWQDICSRDVYLTAHEAIELGLADKLIEPKKRGNLRKMRQAGLKRPVNPKYMKQLISHIYTRIGRTRVPKIEFNEIVKEPADPSIIIDTATSQTPTIISPPIDHSIK